MRIPRGRKIPETSWCAPTNNRVNSTPLGFGKASQRPYEYLDLEGNHLVSMREGYKQLAIGALAGRAPAGLLLDCVEGMTACDPGCVKSRTDAMILFVNRRAGATDVRLRRGD